MKKLEFNVIGTNGRSMLTDVQFNYLTNSMPIVFFVHGFKGFKDWGHFNLVAAQFAEAGFLFVKFNFSHNGTTAEQPIDFVDLKAFGDNNYIYELNDLETVMNEVLIHRELEKHIDKNRIYLIGHSRGGGISLLKANEDKQIKKIITWASVNDFINRNSTESIQAWNTEGVSYTYNARTKQNMPMYKQFYDCILENKDRLDVNKAVENLKIPYLIIHGTHDEVVNINEAKMLREKCKHAELVMIENGNHTFGATHPWDKQSLSTDASIVVNKSIEFLKE